MAQVDLTGGIGQLRPSGRTDLTAWDRQRRGLTVSLMAVPVIAMVILFAAPILVLVWMSFGGGSSNPALAGYEALLQPVYLRLLGFTLQLAVVVTVICAVMAYPIAYLMVNITSKFNQWMAVTLFIMSVADFTSSSSLTPGFSLRSMMAFQRSTWIFASMPLKDALCINAASSLCKAGER